MSNKSQLPMVSVCTPTFNRRPFIQNMFQCFKNQDYPKHRIEWIIVDDGTDKIKDLVENSNIPQIRYFEVDKKMTLGAKRNYMHKFVRGSIIVYMDDDDYYPPDRISHAVERLQQNPTALCAGSSEIYIYFKSMDKMYQCGPYAPNHATAGTFAFRAELLQLTKYEEHAALAEERAFLKEYTIPFVQLDPLKTILVFSHEHNTFDKRKMLDSPHPDYLKVSSKTVDTFIKNVDNKEFSIKKFFMNDIDELLKNYDEGLPNMKPDVLEQIKEIEKSREEYSNELQKQGVAGGNGGKIILQRKGQEPLELSMQDVVNIIKEQQQVISELNAKIDDLTSNSDKYLNEKEIKLKNQITLLQRQLFEKTKTLKSLSDELTVIKQTIPTESFTKIPIEIIEENENEISISNLTPPPQALQSQPAIQKKISSNTKCEPEIIVDIGE